MNSKGDLVRASVALDTEYKPEDALLQDLERADASHRGKLLRALIRAGFAASVTEDSTQVSSPQSGAEHGT